jgi:quinol monooxygenase YgiN
MAKKLWQWALFVLVLWVCAFPQPVRADTQQYVVVYVELRPDSRAQGERLLDQLASNARSSPGALRFDVDQEVQRSNFYVLIETWDNTTDYQNFANSAKTQALLTQLSSFLIAPLDERDGTLIQAGKSAAAPTHAGETEVVTHIDVIPTFLDQAKPLIQQFVSDSAHDPGVREFLLVSCDDITNHFQLIERYQSGLVFDNHVSAQHSVQFRDALQPFIGAPYDERVYVTHP